MNITDNSKLELLAEKIKNADAVLIGGGSGLSSAAGYNHYHWSPAIADALRPFREYYGFKSPLDGFYHCFSSYEEQWGYYSRYIKFMWEVPTGKPYIDLKKIVNDKTCFVLTTNIDMQFYRVFSEEQIFSYQGDFRYCQCVQPCHDILYDTSSMSSNLSRQLLYGIRLPAEAVPRCLHCGRVMVPWVRDDTFLEGELWHAQAKRYYEFQRNWFTKHNENNILLLELGVGEMTPSIIKLPFWELTAKHKNVFYACLNREASHAPEHIRDRSLYICGDLAETLSKLRKILTRTYTDDGKE